MFLVSASTIISLYDTSLTLIPEKIEFCEPNYRLLHKTPMYSIWMRKKKKDDEVWTKTT